MLFWFEVAVKKEKIEPVVDLSQADVQRIKEIVYRGKAEMCWFAPDRKEAKGLIKLAEEYFKTKE